MHALVRNSIVRAILLQLVAAFIVTTSAVAQTAPNPPAPTPTAYEQAFAQAMVAQQQASTGNTTVGFVPAILSIPGQAFTAQRTYTQWDTDGDSTNPNVTTNVTIARDSQGRIHYENSLTPGMVEVIVSDPVGQLSYRYMAGQPASIQLVATTCTQPVPPSSGAPAPATITPAATPPPIPTAPTPSKQDLGTQTIEGTSAIGQQQTRYLTIDTGTVTIQLEDWFSPTLGLNVKETNQTSGQASHTILTHQVQLGDPDPTLFAPPAGFTLPDPSANCGTQSIGSPANNIE